jgi:hypothetical protein
MEDDVDTGNESRLFLTLGGSEVEVAQILDIPEMPRGEAELFETTHMTTGRIKTHKKKPRKDGAEVTITGNYIIMSDAETHLQAADDIRTAIPYRIELKQDDKLVDVEGTALFYNFTRLNPMDDRRTFAISVKWNSVPTQTVQA